MKNALQIKWFLISLTILMASCSNNDDGDSSVNSFYSEADTSATEQELIGIWAVFTAEYEGETVDIPIDYQECGRDFFIYSENGTYTEYFYQSSDCELLVNPLNWQLNNGVINISNSLGESDEVVITKLTANELSFKSRVDVDQDGELDILTINARLYVPTDVDLVSNTFNRNYNEGFENLLSFTWDAYQGFNDFSRYEIYRSVGENCSYENAELIATITDSAVSEYTDLTPPAEETLCYYLKTYTQQELLGQSFIVQVETFTLQAIPVSLNQPMVVNNQIELNWEASTMPYFSHYEIIVSNYPGNITGYAKQVNTVTEIDDINTTSFTDINPPYLENPYYGIFVYDIFGNRTYLQNQNPTTYWEVNFVRDEIIGMKSIESYAIDTTEPIIYFYGRESGDEISINIHRFNYETNQTEAISNLSPSTSTSRSIKFFNTPLNGKEIMIEQGSDLHVYDAVTLDYKYALNPNEIFSMDEFIYSNAGFWILTDNDDVFTYVRDNANFTLVDSKPHYANHQGTYNYQVFDLNGNQLLVGHNNEPNSLVYTMDANGMLTLEQTVAVPIVSGSDEKSLYSSSGNYIINLLENRLYSTTSFTFLESFEEPYYPSGVSQDGTKIFGTNNDPNWQITDESLHEKEAIIYTRLTQALEAIETIGYPHVIFENFNGDIISISSGLKKDDIGQNINDKADIFMEIVNIP